MSKPYTCPNCCGVGKLPGRTSSAYDTCHSCRGAGVLWEPKDATLCKLCGVLLNEPDKRIAKGNPLCDNPDCHCHGIAVG